MPPNVRRRAMLGLAVCAGLALSGCLGYDGDFDRGYQVDEDTLSQVKVGAYDQARSPRPARHSLDHLDGRRRRLVCNIGQKMKHTLQFMPVQMADQHVLAVYFDKDGKVDRIANYGMQDGKVFDFVSRTTPTGGQEPDFLKNMMGGLFKWS